MFCPGGGNFLKVNDDPPGRWRATLTLIRPSSLEANFQAEWIGSFSGGRCGLVVKFVPEKKVRPHHLSPPMNGPRLTFRSVWTGNWQLDQGPGPGQSSARGPDIPCKQYLP